MKKKNSFIETICVFIIFIILSLACATYEPIKYDFNKIDEPISIPTLNKVVTVHVGDILLSQGIRTKYKEKCIVIRFDSLNGDVKKGIYEYYGIDNNNGNKIYKPIFPTGANLPSSNHFLSYGKFSEQFTNFTEEKHGAEKSSNKKTFNENVLSMVFLVSGGFRRINSIPENNYEFIDYTNEKEDSFQQTIIYTGLVDNIINFSYREFSNFQARPAYTIDVQYDLTKSNIIMFKEAVIEIIEATSNTITYTVLKNFVPDTLF